MKIFTVISLAALMILSVGCTSEKIAAPSSSESLDYDVIGSEAPASIEIAMAELNNLAISVPNPIPANDPSLSQELDAEVALVIVNSATLDDSGRVNFRRIIAHLYDQMHMLRRCMAENHDPRLQRLAYGAAHAIQQGLRALQNGEPRVALRLFHEANRILNLANTLCHGRG
jgi:hypothetical protein